MLFDSHTHLNFEKYSEDERRGLAAEIEASELAFIVDVADGVASARQALADAAAYRWCYAAVGIHPDHASDYRGIFGRGSGQSSRQSTDKCGEADTEMSSSERRLRIDLEEIRRLAADPKAVCIGEIGLDFYYGKDDQEEQQELFRRQIRLANELRLPIMIHSRDAHQLTMDILKEEGAFSEERKSWFPGRPAPGTMSAGASGHDVKLPGEYEYELKDACDLKLYGSQGLISTKGEPCSSTGDRIRLVPDARVQMHCFSGSPELAAEYIKLGATISLGGPVTFKNGKKAAEAARQTPIECLLSETDAPYMAPEPLRGRPNKSPYIEHIVRRMAILKGISYEEAARILTANGRRFFGISA